MNLDQSRPLTVTGDVSSAIMMATPNAFVAIKLAIELAHYHAIKFERGQPRPLLRFSLYGVFEYDTGSPAGHPRCAMLPDELRDMIDRKIPLAPIQFKLEFQPWAPKKTTVIPAEVAANR